VSDTESSYRRTAAESGLRLNQGCGATAKLLICTTWQHFDSLPLLAPAFKAITWKRETLLSMHERMGRGGHGLPKVSLGLAMPDHSKTYGRAIPETAIQLFQGCPVMAEKWIFNTWISTIFLPIIIKKWRIGFRLIILAKINCSRWIIRSELNDFKFWKQAQSDLHIKISFQFNIAWK
jgi:hypothetical protein